jgi:hypothetical protein
MMGEQRESSANVSNAAQRWRSRCGRWTGVVYSVFGDESADETKQRVFAVAGIFGSEDDWSTLKDPWVERNGGQVFHATDCESDKDIYADRPHSENQKLYADCVRLLRRSKLMGFAAVIDLAGHRAYFPDAPEDVPYFKCFYEVVHTCGKWAKWSIPQGTVEFTFDSRRQSDYTAGVLYDYMTNVPEWKESWLFADKINFWTSPHKSKKPVGIQVADLYAREAMKHLDNMIGPVQRPERIPMFLLRQEKRFGCNVYMREHFEDFRKKFEDVSCSAGLNRAHYAAWLEQHRLPDRMSSRYRYLIELEAEERDIPTA